MTAVAAQQAVADEQRKEPAAARAQLAVQGQQIALIARLAGVTAEVDALAKTATLKQADIANPAQPIPDPGEQVKMLTQSFEEAAKNFSQQQGGDRYNEVDFKILEGRLAALNFTGEAAEKVNASLAKVREAALAPAAKP